MSEPIVDLIHDYFRLEDGPAQAGDVLLHNDRIYPVIQPDGGPCLCIRDPDTNELYTFVTWYSARKITAMGYRLFRPKPKPTPMKGEVKVWRSTGLEAYASMPQEMVGKRIRWEEVLE